MEATKERVVQCVENLRHALRQERMSAGTGCDHPPPIFIQEMSDEGLLAWDLGIYELALLALEARESSAIQVSRESWDRLLERNAKLEAENAFHVKQVERTTARVKLIEARAGLAREAFSGALDGVLGDFHGPRITSVEPVPEPVPELVGFEGVTVRFEVSLSAWAGHETETQVHRFCKLVRERIEKRLSGVQAHVVPVDGPQSIQIESSHGALHVEAQLSIEVEVAEIGFEVWNEGVFW